MKFWDSSAIAPLLVDEALSAEVRGVFASDAELMVWWGTGVECVSAIARREREGLDAAVVSGALQRLDALAASWREMEPVDAVRRTASRLLRVHALRAADALQLAAAILAAEDRASSLPFVTLDQRLVLAAGREGFPVITWA